MKKLIVSSALALTVATGFIGFKALKVHRQQICDSWLQSAITAQTTGYHSRAIDKLTLYFSEDNCRGKTDPQAITTLANARPHVPLPGGTELVQQLSLSRLGWQLERDPSFQLTQAKAALALGDWTTAAELADYASGARADFIKIAAAVRLKDWQKLQETVDELDTASTSSFQYALLSEMLVDAPVHLPARPLQSKFTDFARSILRGGDNQIDKKAYAVNNLLTMEDLNIATGLLVATRQTKAVIALLDQPRRPLSPSLLKKLAKQYWLSHNHAALMDFQQRNIDGALPGETILLICLAEQEMHGVCTTSFDAADYEARHGNYASSHWKKLLQLLQSSATPAHEIVDALVEMEDLIRKEPIAYQLLASLYSELGEVELAKRFEGAASMFGLSPKGKWHINEKPSWTSKLADGYMPTQAEVSTLQDLSPKQSILWRLAKSRLALSKNTDEGAAEALRIIRPVLGWAPEVASAQLIAAASTAHFGDHEASYGHLMNAVSADPKSTVAALRLSLHFYSEKNGLTATELNHWWETLTRAEVQNNNPENTIKLIAERAMILAAIAEEEQDSSLAQNAYRTVLKEQPDNHIALNNLAVWLSKDLATVVDAKKLAETAIALAPEQPEYHGTLQDVEAVIQEQLRAGTT